MAKTPDQLSRYFDIASRLGRGDSSVGHDDIEFFLSYSPSIDESKIQKLVDGGEFASFEDAQSAIIEAGRALQSSPQYKQQTLDIARKAEQGKVSDNLVNGFNLVLAGTDVANSISQIKRSNAGLKANPRPARPAIPQRDMMLQQALRNAQEGTFDAGRALAPAQAQIQDQYLSDIQNGKTASTGQAGEFGAYAQLAANRRNRAALQLAPMQDEIRRGQQARYDNLLGMRMDETQRMFDNQNSLYGQDLNQYNLQQQAYRGLGSQGRSNLRNSLYNAAPQVANTIASNYTDQKYRNLYNQMNMYGQDAAEAAVKAEQNLDGYVGNPYSKYQTW